MENIKVSIEAAQKAITYSNEAKEQLLSNINIMDNNVNSQFSGLQDPTLRRYLELSEQMQGLLRQIGGRMDAISEYCQSVISWIINYTES